MTNTAQSESVLLEEDQTLTDNATLLADSTVQAGTIEDETAGSVEDFEDLAGGDLPIGRFKVVGDTLHLGDQRRISPICCSVFSTVEALCNMDGRPMDHDLVRSIWNLMIKDKKVIANVGAYGSDGTRYAVDLYNSKYGTKYIRRPIVISPENMIKAFAQYNSPIVTGIRGSSEYFKDEQDDGKIKIGSKPGNLGHYIAFVIGNSTGVPQKFGIRAKYLEHYIDTKTFNVIEVDLSDMHANGLLFKTGYYFTK